MEKQQLNMNWLDLDYILLPVFHSSEDWVRYCFHKLISTSARSCTVCWVLLNKVKDFCLEKQFEQLMGGNGFRVASIRFEKIRRKSHLVKSEDILIVAFWKRPDKDSQLDTGEILCLVTHTSHTNDTEFLKRSKLN